MQDAPQWRERGMVSICDRAMDGSLGRSRCLHHLSGLICRACREQNFSEIA
jgi:hypothetical protein